MQAVVVGIALMGSAVSAADYTWTTNTTAGQALTDGAGNFTAGGFNWALNGDINSRVVWPASTSDTAVFGAGSGTAGTVTTTAPMTANGLKFAQTGSGSYTILLGSNVNSITLGGTTPTITVNSGVSATITANSTGGDGRLLGNDVTITGGGTLTFSLMSTTANSTTGGLAALGRGSSNNTNTSITQDGNTTVNFSGTGGWTLANDSSGNNVGGSGKATYTLKSGTLAGSSGTANDNFLQIGRNWAAEFKQEGGTVSLNATLANTLTIGGRGNGTYTLSGGTFSATAGGLLMSGSVPGSGSAPVSALSISGGTMRFGLAGVMASASGSSSSVTLSGGQLAINTLTKGTSGTVTSFAFSGGTLRPYNNNATFGSTTAGNNFTITLSGTGATFSGTDNATSAARTTTVEALLSGTGRVNVNGGTVQFGNASNNYSGWTVISAGKLNLDADATLGSSSRVVVGSAGSSGTSLDLTAKSTSFTFTSGQTVAGIGTLNIGSGKTVISQGTWAPGNSIGSNAVTGNLQLSGTSEFELGTPGTSTSSPGTSDFTAVSGALTLGGTLSLLDNANADGLGSAAGGVYRLFTYGSTLSGSYSSVTAPNAATRVGLGNITDGGAGTGSGQGVFVTVWNKAAAGTLTTPLDLGTVLTGSSMSQALSIANTAPSGNFSEKLNASFGTVTSATSSGSVNLLAAGSTDTTSMLVGFNTATAGAKSGSAQVNFATDGTGTSGLGTLSLDSQTVSLTGTVLDPATASFDGGTTDTVLNLNIGSFSQNTGIHTLGFDIFNLLATAGYTAELDLVSIVGDVGNSASLSSDLATFTGLAAGSSNSYIASLSSATVGSFQNTYTLSFRSSKNGSTFAGETPQTMTLVLEGVIAVPEPAALTLAGLGLAGGAICLYRSRRKESGSAQAC